MSSTKFENPDMEELRFPRVEPKKPQLFEYKFRPLKDGINYFVRSSDINHALGNCDQYPIPYDEISKGETPEARLCSEMLSAVMTAIGFCPRFKIDTAGKSQLSIDNMKNQLLGKLKLLRNMCEHRTHGYIEVQGFIARADDLIAMKIR